jgi:uncharacterized membrane protein
MAFCPNCGATVEGKFCPTCGTAVGSVPSSVPSGAAPSPSYTASAGGYPPPPPGAAPGYTQPPPGSAQGYGPPPGPAPAASSGMADNVASTLCYVLGLLTGILFLVLEPYNRNRNVRFHAFQSIFFHVGMIVCWIALWVVSFILAHIPILGWIIDLLLWLVLSIGALVVWIMLMVKAYNNSRLVLPIVGPLAEKQA